MLKTVFLCVTILIANASARPQFGFLGALERDIEIGVERGSEIGAEIAVQRDFANLQGYGYGNSGYGGYGGYSGYGGYGAYNGFYG